MRFDLPESIAAMRAGRKTQTRRRNVKFWLKKKPGDRITIVHQGKYLGWARVDEVWRQRLGHMNDRDAKCEGYDGLISFANAWRYLYGNVDPNEVVVAISFHDVHWGES